MRTNSSGFCTGNWRSNNVSTSVKIVALAAMPIPIKPTTTAANAGAFLTWRQAYCKSVMLEKTKTASRIWRAVSSKIKNLTGVYTNLGIESTCFSIIFRKSDLPIAPTFCSTTCPPLKSRNMGIPRT